MRASRGQRQGRWWAASQGMQCTCAAGTGTGMCLRLLGRQYVIICKFQPPEGPLPWGCSLPHTWTYSKLQQRWQWGSRGLSKQARQQAQQGSRHQGAAGTAGPADHAPSPRPQPHGVCTPPHSTTTHSTLPLPHPTPHPPHIAAFRPAGPVDCQVSVSFHTRATRLSMCSQSWLPGADIRNMGSG